MGGGGGKGGGGGGGGATSTINVTNSGTTNVDVDSTSTVEIQGLDDIQQTLTLNLPQPFRTDSRNELVLPQPFRTESRQELAVTEPIRTEGRNDLALDIRPMTVDLCLNLNVGPPAPTCIRQPYHHHFGLTLFGIELLGLNFSGESQTIVQDAPKQRPVAWGGTHSRPREPRHEHHAHAEHTEHKAVRVRLGGDPPPGAPAEPRAGLRIRLGS
jgi:hypothetical protein